MDSAKLIELKSSNKLIEMVWFGGISGGLSNHVFHATLELAFGSPASQESSEDPSEE